MKHILKKQSIQAGIALTALVASTAFVTGTALADPTPKPLTFAKADISIATRDSEAQHIAAGDLVCSFRETGLNPFALVSYECRADAAAILEGCFFKNKLVIDAGTELTVATDVSNVEPGGHEEEVFLANNSGTINGEVITAVEEEHTPGGGHLCPEPLEQGVIAARWCGMSLTDTTNNIVGAEVTELLETFTKGAFTVPSCAEILAP